MDIYQPCENPTEHDWNWGHDAGPNGQGPTGREYWLEPCGECAPCKARKQMTRKK